MKRLLKYCIFPLLTLFLLLCYLPQSSQITAGINPGENDSTEQLTPSVQEDAVPPPEPAPEVPQLMPVSHPDGTYSGSVTSKLGDLIYYNQHDTRWSQYLWGGSDPLDSYGCGPTTLAMIISSFTEQAVTPPDAAVWASENGYHSPGSGSFHNIIPDGLTAYGLNVQSQQVLTPDGILSTLNDGKILVALMGPGHFTQKGHFIIMTGTTEDGLVTVADPQSLDLTLQTWDPALILEELKDCGYGGPVWVVSTVY